MAHGLLPFGRDTPCPACGIALEIVKVCEERHPDMVPEPAGPGGRLEHLHVVCSGCGWSAYMEVAGRRDAPAATDRGSGSA